LAPSSTFAENHLIIFRGFIDIQQKCRVALLFAHTVERAFDQKAAQNFVLVYIDLSSSSSSALFLEQEIL